MESHEEQHQDQMVQETKQLASQIDDHAVETLQQAAPKKLKVEIDLGELVKAQDEGKDLVFSPNAEQGIIRLLEMHKLVAEAINFVQSEIERQGLEFNKNFTSVAGDLIKANYSASGARYKADLSQVKHPQKPFWKHEMKYTIVPEEVEKYELKHRGKLPKGISKPERKRSIRLTVKGA